MHLKAAETQGELRRAENRCLRQQILQSGSPAAGALERPPSQFWAGAVQGGTAAGLKTAEDEFPTRAPIQWIWEKCEQGIATIHKPEFETCALKTVHPRRI